MFELPITVEIGGAEFSIRSKGDYRLILGIFDILEDAELDENERMICALIAFYEDIDEIEDIQKLPDLEEAVRGMFNFFNAGKPESQSATPRKLIDWSHDEAMIASAVNHAANTEVRAVDYMHWWTFLSYYMAIGECTLSTVVAIRDKILKGKSLEKWEQQFRSENPHYFNWNHRTVEDIEAEQWALSVWNKE